MDIEKIIKEVKQIEEQSEFIVSWFAKKYQKKIIKKTCLILLKEMMKD